MGHYALRLKLMESFHSANNYRGYPIFQIGAIVYIERIKKDRLNEINVLNAIFWKRLSS